MRTHRKGNRVEMQTRRELEPQPEPEEAARRERESFGDLLGQLANQSAALVRDEITLARQEMNEKVESLRSGVIVVAAGAVVALVSLFALCAAAIIGLGHYVGMGWSALIIGAVLAIVGGITIFVGLNNIKQTSLKPKQTIQTLEEDKKWLKEMT